MSYPVHGCGVRRTLLPVAVTIAILGALSPSHGAKAAVGPLTASVAWSATLVGHAPTWTAPWQYAGVAVGDLEGTGAEDVVGAFTNGVVDAWDPAGNQLPGWPKTVGSIYSAPTLADLRGDGRLEVIVGSNDGNVHVWGGDGSYLPGWPQHFCAPNRTLCGSFATPAVGDVFNNGQKELFITSWDHYIYGINANGAPMSGFPLYLWDTVFDTPTLVDIDGNGQLDIVVGSDSSGAAYNEPYPAGGVYWAFRNTGCSTPGSTPTCGLPGWPKAFDQVPWGSAAVGVLGGQTAIVAGTGTNFPPPKGRYINAWRTNGSNVTNWPKTTGGATFGSPAIGTLSGASLQVVASGGDGLLDAWNADGSNVTGWPVNPATTEPGCGFSTAAQSTPVVGPVGATTGVWVTCGGKIIGFDGAGVEVVQAALPSGGVSSAPPVIADLGNGHLTAIISSKWGGDGSNTKYSITAYDIPNTTTTTIAPTDWPTFHGNNQRAGQVAPMARVTAATQVGGTTQVTVTWASISAIPSAGYNVWSKDVTTGAPWQFWLQTVGTSTSFFGVAGHTYNFFVQAYSRAALDQGLVSTQPPASVVLPGGATMPAGVTWNGVYAIDAFGTTRPGSSPPLATPQWDWSIVRGIALRPGATSGWVVDGWGGIHAFGGAPLYALGAGDYFTGWDIARGIAAIPAGGFVVDGFGGLHKFGTVIKPSPNFYWPGWDIANGVVQNPCDATGNSGYVLEHFGGVHAFGGAPPVQVSGYWNWNIARSIAIDPSTCGSGNVTGYVLDGYGGIHPFWSTAAVPVPAISGYWSGWDIARSIVMQPGGAGGSGWVVDAYGGYHKFGTAPVVVTGHYTPGQDIVRGVSAA